MYFSKIKICFRGTDIGHEFVRRFASKTSSEQSKPSNKACWDGKLIRSCKSGKITPSKEEKPCKECPKVAILGAGMAGMSAASRLATAGMDNFVVLEAKNRVGGRIHSAWSGEGLNELGAEWLEGEWNPILRLASLEGLTSCVEDNSNCIFMDEEGKSLGQAGIDEAKKTLCDLQDEAVKIFCEKRETDFFGVSLLDFFKKKEAEIKWKDPVAKVLFSAMTHGGLCRMGGPSDELSLNDLASRFHSKVRTRIREGLVGTFGPMMKDVAPNKIKFKSRVINVYWSECPIRIELEDCSEITADFVLVTFSLGVLRNNPDLFDPELPEDKAEAIRSTGFATSNKVFLDYAEPFWLRGDGRIILSRPADHNCTDWMSAVYQIREICGGRNTLQFSVCGKPALDLEQIDEEEVAQNLTDILRQFTGVNSTPYPIGLTRTRWSLDPCYLGSCSFMGKHSNKKHLRVLAQPLPGLCAIPRLLFAGDATSGGHIGTVEGARLSGYREAQRILDLLCLHGWPPKPRENMEQQYVYAQNRPSCIS